MVVTFSISCILIMQLAGAKENIEEIEEDEEVSRYGSDWVLFPDDFGKLHFVNICCGLTGDFSFDEYKRRVYFLLYTRNNPDEFEELYIDDGDDAEAGDDVKYRRSDEESKKGNSTYYEGENPLHVLIHGWQSSGHSSTILDLKDAYLHAGDVNVIAVDWSEIAKEYTYIVAAEMTKHVGLQGSTGRMVHTLMKQYNFDGSIVHIVGHSLGAHVSGYSGKHLNEINSTISRITGLDPARPLFEYPIRRGLNSSDAMFVDVIHSNGGVLGVRHAIGHADFFPNGGGPSQPGCYDSGELPDACAHARSHQYFCESIMYGGFKSRSCGSWADYKNGECERDGSEHNMGEKCSDTALGSFYLYTNAESRYSQDDD